MTETAITATRAITVRRHYRSPPARVFAAWTTPEMVDAWWGPAGFTTKVHTLEARPGGRFHFEMVAPTGSASHTAGTYVEVDPPRRLVFEITDHCTADVEPGEQQHVPARVIVEFVATADGTALTLTHENLSDGFAEPAWAQALEKLEAAL
ncbi:MAG: SRPBCC domain-containing protein [Alphaproteobacteria bacterium]